MNGPANVSPRIARTAKEIDEVVQAAANVVEFQDSQDDDAGEQLQPSFADGVFMALQWILGLPTTEPETAAGIIAQLDATYPPEILEELRQAEEDAVGEP